MSHRISRRELLKRSTWFTGMGLAGLAAFPQGDLSLFRISLAQWSLHRTLFAGRLDPLDFARVARGDFDIEAVEYVNQFFADKAKDRSYLREMKRRAEGEGVKSLLIMCDQEGRLGDPDGKERRQAVENHHKWLEAAAYLGCHSIRVNAHSEGSFEEQKRLVTDGLRGLVELAAEEDLGVIVENHGGLSSHGQWLASVIEAVDHERCGTLPDFGNFGDYGGLSFNSGAEPYDRYRGVAQLMPYAKGVSAKSYSFDDEGNEVDIDYRRMMKIVLDSGYRGYVGIEYGGQELGEREGVAATQRLLKRLRQELAPDYA